MGAGLRKQGRTMYRFMGFAHAQQHQKFKNLNIYTFRKNVCQNLPILLFHKKIKIDILTKC